MVERQTQVATSGKWRPQRSGEESATAPWIARVEAHCTCTLHSWDLKYLKKHIRPQPWHLWQFGEGEQYHFLTGCLEVHWMYAIVFHWKYMLVCTKADGWASSFVDWPISFVHSILIKVCSCVPQFYFTSWVSSFAEVSGNLAWFACQPLKPSWNLHWSELVNVFTHTPAVSAVSKEEGWDSEAEAEEVNAVCAVKQKKEKKGREQAQAEVIIHTVGQYPCLIVTASSAPGALSLSLTEERLPRLTWSIELWMDNGS